MLAWRRSGFTPEEEFFNRIDPLLTLTNVRFPVARVLTVPLSQDFAPARTCLSTSSTASMTVCGLSS